MGTELKKDSLPDKILFCLFFVFLRKATPFEAFVIFE